MAEKKETYGAEASECAIDSTCRPGYAYRSKPRRRVQSGIQRGVQRRVQRGFRQGFRGRTPIGIQSAIGDDIAKDIAAPMKDNLNVPAPELQDASETDH
ncbi:hypothetical protein [Paenibacillus sp. JJ-100]|uniref:hypothetical protein n=1 Tax=Paenibacillus sp. JJ-100 TaxID=2974896 RepID=UPI00232CE451|nr:hypothetical protein [Paenibacillus sp. JJ-100]